LSASNCLITRPDATLIEAKVADDRDPACANPRDARGELRAKWKEGARRFAEPPPEELSVDRRGIR